MDGNFYTHDYEKEDSKFESAIAKMLRVRKVPKINRAEREILEFCHNRNMKEFLREEFEKHPIKLDENGNLIGENPFDKERREQGVVESYQGYDPLFGEIRTQQILRRKSYGKLIFLLKKLIFEIGIIYLF